MGTVENTTDTSQPFRLFIENVVINDTCMTVYIRNPGNREITVDKAYVNKEPCSILCFNNKATIPKNCTGKVYIPGSYSKGALYEIRIVCTSGSTLLSIQRY
jgi:hypothetical protein